MSKNFDFRSNNVKDDNFLCKKTSLLTYKSCKILQDVDLVIFKIFPGLRLCEECYRTYVIFDHMTRVHIYLILYFIRIITKYIQLTRHTDLK